MHFDLIDKVLEREANRIVTLKLVSSAEEYLQDHFAGYPVLPGVFMLEAMVQAARLLEADHAQPPERLCIASVRALKYAGFVRPGQSLRVSLERSAELEYKATGHVIDADPATPPTIACIGRFTLRRPNFQSATTPSADLSNQHDRG